MIKAISNFVWKLDAIWRSKTEEEWFWWKYKYILMPFNIAAVIITIYLKWRLGCPTPGNVIEQVMTSPMPLY